MMPSLFDRPAVLFLPASRASAIAKARASAADLVILDLEDAVRSADKATARDAAAAAVVDGWPMPVGIRVNAVGTLEHEADIAEVAASKCDFIVLPSVRSADEVARASTRVGKPVVAMIETAAAVIAAPEIARAAAALIIGTNDLAAELRLPTLDRAALSYALQATLLAARGAGIAAFDGVFNRLDDPCGFAAEAAQGRSLGFDGKTLIHPDQIAPCHAAFAPGPAEIARAKRLVAAASGGAERFEGEMVEAMHVAAARRLLERAGR